MSTVSRMLERYKEINPSFTEYVTDFCHGNHIQLTKAPLKFLKKAFEINVIGQELWSLLDFRYMSQNNFRKMIQRLAPLIEKVVNSRPCFYKLKGIQMDCVTKRPRGLYTKDIEPTFEQVLAIAKTQPPMMHDIRVQGRVSELFENIMKNTDLEPNPHNWSFTIRIPAGNRFEVKVNLYRNNKMQVIIGCTHQPIPYDLGGFLELSTLLGKICNHLKELGGSEFYHNPIPDWKVLYLHLNKDGAEISGKRFSYSIVDLANHSVFYLKKFKDGTLRPRYEEHQRPKKTIAELMKPMEMD